MGRSFILHCGCLLLFLFPTTVAAEGESRAAVLLRKSQLLPPVESAGSGLAPEVELQVTVDARGQVETVEVLSIKPPSELDDVFRRNTEKTVSRWRYAPAVENGEPVPVTLRWSVQYRQAPEASAASDEASLLPVSLFLREDANQRHARILGLPLGKRKEILLRYSGIAEQSLDAAYRRQTSTQRFVVVTDAEEPKTAEIVANNLEVTTNVTLGLLGDVVEPRTDELKVLVYLFRTQAALMKAQEALCLSAGYGVGTYLSPGLIVMSLEARSSDALLSDLIHESTHAYSDRFLRRAGFAMPLWMEEGLAEYMANSQIRKGHLEPGRLLRRKYVFIHANNGAPVGITAAHTDGGWNLARIKRAIAAGEGIPLAELVASDHNVFYGDRRNLFYGTSWLLAHFLRHGRPEWEEKKRFPELILYLAEGYPASLAVESVYGLSFEQLEEPFKTYVQKF